MEKAEKTIEEQIKDADFLNKLKERGGDEAVELGKEFLKMSDDERESAVLACGLRKYLKMDTLRSMVFIMALRIVRDKCPHEAEAITGTLIHSFGELLKADIIYHKE